MADARHALRQDRVDVGIVRIVEGRHEDPRRRRPLLMHVVRDDRLERAVDLLHREPRFDLREHEPVAIVVVADVLVIEVGVDAGEAACPSSCTSDR